MAWPAMASENAKQIMDTQYSDNFVSEKYVSQYDTSSCVIFAREVTSRDDIRGWAGDLKPTSDKPYVGGVVITREGRGHVAIIQSIIGDTLYIIEANYLPNQITHRQLKITDVNIRGYK